MAQVINTNVMSLNAQRNLNSSSSSLATSVQRLSSGLRINSAKDDAAGLAISERFTTQIRGLDVAIRNANDGISLSQTAEGAMVEVSNNLQRIRELAVQAANATNSASDRKALQAEVTQLINEMGRVASQTNFNNINLLDGSFTGAQFQVGANAGETISINTIVNTKPSVMGKTTFHLAEIDKGTSTITSIAHPTEANKAGYSEVAAKQITLNNVTIDVPALPASANNAYASGDAAAAGEKAYGALLAASINARSTDTGIIAEDLGNGNVKLTQVKGDSEITGDIKTGTKSSIDKVVSDFDITTPAGAQMAILMADKALESVNASRADMGAIQNRFQSTIANLTTTSENLSASRSRIRDADYAKETAELTRTQILQQAGTAMLAQANSLPNSVLSLLQQ